VEAHIKERYTEEELEEMDEAERRLLGILLSTLYVSAYVCVCVCVCVYVSACKAASWYTTVYYICVSSYVCVLIYMCPHI
jgi:hypothetical protein